MTEDSNETSVAEDEKPNEEAEALIVDEGAVVEKSKLETLQEKNETLIAQAEDLLERYSEINEVVSSDAVLNVGQHYYKQLAASAERARATLKHIETHLDKKDKVSELVAEHLEDTIDEISNNLEQLDKGLSGFFEKDDESSAIESDIKKHTTGAIEVAKDEEAEGVVVPITLAKKPEPEPVRASASSVIHNETIKPSGERVEKAFKGELGRVIDKVLAIPRYGSFVKETFPSPVQFELMLRREIQRVEAVSKFDSVFGFTYKSPFNDFLRDMTVKEIADFEQKFKDDRNELREFLKNKDIKYEAYLDWVDSLQSMIELTHAHPTITFGELFVRAELETLLQHHEAMAA